MPRSSVTFVCAQCGGETLRWAGQCPYCHEWNTLQEFEVKKEPGRRKAESRSSRSATVGGSSARPVPVTQISADSAPRLRLAWGELNRVLGGGIVPGSLVLVGGEPGVGKSTLLMHAAHQDVNGGGAKVLYVSGEESNQQAQMRAARLGALDGGILLMAENDLDAICDTIASEAPQLAIVDSIQTVADAAVSGSAGSVRQVKESADRLMRPAKETGVPIFLVGQLTKAGEIGVFAMGERGLEEVPDPSAAMLSQTGTASAGTAVVVVMEGTRPLLIEIQSLVNKANTNFPPRRVANGFDLNRVHMLLAVLDRRGKTPLGQHDVFVNVAGGIRISEPAADLGLALSIAGNQRSQPLPEGLVVLGELGLAGEVRRVGQTERRLQEAARHGFTRALIPSGSRTGRPAGLEITEVRTLAEAISALFPNHIHSGAFIEEAGVTVS